MRFAPRPRRRVPESIIPMINVVFLLLIFFLMSARLAPPPPVQIEVPRAGSDRRASDQAVLYLDATGPRFGDLRGDAVWQAMAELAPGVRLTLRADATLPGTEVAKTLAQLAGMGITAVDIAVRDR